MSYLFYYMMKYHRQATFILCCSMMCISLTLIIWMAKENVVIQTNRDVDRAVKKVCLIQKLLVKNGWS